MDNDFILGMDGGGTATVVSAFSKNGGCLGEWKAGSLNVNGQSYEKTIGTVADIVLLIEKAGLPIEACRGICIGAAGISNQDTEAVITGALRQAGMEGAIKLVGDQETALAAAFPELWGVILIAGTGSICYGKSKDGTAYRVGGYGHIIDDAGSAYAIGRDILQAVVRGYDGRTPATVLTDLVYKKLNIGSMGELISWLYAPDRTKKEIAALASLSEEAAGIINERAEDAAVAILAHAAEELALLAGVMLQRIPETNKIVLSGSVLLKNKIVRKKFADCINRLYPQVMLEETKESAAVGAARIIRKELGWE